MKVYQSVAILSFLSTSTLGAAIIQPSAVPAKFTPPVRRQANDPDSAASSLETNPSPSDVPGATGGGNGGGPFVPYSGPASEFPDPKEWASFTTMWDKNVREMKIAGNSDEENKFIKEGIFTVASSSSFDSRAILGTIMQESTGNVRVNDTYGFARNSGLMQSYEGVKFDPKDPKGSILQMIRDGTEGTTPEKGLKQALASQNGNFYEAFRKYNSGSVNKADLNDGFKSRPLYVQQIANRLMGATRWTEEMDPVAPV
jgi:hypothetical protein